MYGICLYMYVYIYSCADLYQHKSLSFSPSGRMLLETRIDRSAAIWKVPSDATWPTTPHAKFGSVDFDGSAFLGDESHAVTLCKPCFIRIWRVSDGASIASIDTDAKVCHSLSIYSTFVYL